MDIKKTGGTTKRPDDAVSLITHLEELRKRLVYALAAIALCSLAVYPFVDAVIRDLSRPVGTLIFTSPMEAFWSRLKLTFFLGVFAGMPFVLYQAWSFVNRALFPKERRFILSFTCLSFVLFASGAAFCYTYILPVGVRFLLAYGSEVLVPMISISRYLSFAFGLVFSFGLIFELPLVIALLSKAGILKSATLRRQRRYAIVVIFIAAAALTPGPDVFSQLLMAGPLLVLYEAGVIVARIIERRRK